MNINVGWIDIKAFIQARTLSCQYLDIDDKYHIIAFDGPFSVSCTIKKTGNEDQTDFETNFKPAGNRSFTDGKGVQLVTHKPFAYTDNFKFRGDAVSGTATKNTSSSIDHKLTEERFINAGQVILTNHTLGDYIKFQVVDKEYAYAGILYPATYTGGIAWSVVQPSGVVLDEFINKWYVDDNKKSQTTITLDYPARIYVNLYIRLIYTSVGTENDIDVKCNFFLHKKVA